MEKGLEQFTGLYSLSKTLRFELKPEPTTKIRFQNWLNEINNGTGSISDDNLFAKDKKIYNAYIALKPILDKIHEDFITISLQSKKAEEIDFESYYDKYVNKKDLPEEQLRKSVGDAFKETSIAIFNKEKDEKKEKQINNNPIKPLTDKSILAYIEKNINLFISDTLTKKELETHLKAFKGFFTYFSGYNTNRENYYEFKKEQSTAVATRIVHENLPKYCDNIIRFESRKDEYIHAYNQLKDKGRATQIKNKKTGKFQEAKAITEDAFQITHFNQCLSQPQIEEYNALIGNYNLLINLYNQSMRQENGFKKLTEFVTLYKQIGYGKSKTLFVALQKDKECELTDKEKQTDEILTVEKLLQTVAETGNVLFNKPIEMGTITLPLFIEWLRKCEDWNGIYWSKPAITKISNLFFNNWHDLKDKLKDNKACVSYDEKREEQIKLNDAIELSGLFNVLDKENAEFVFKPSLFNDDNYKDIINKELLPSKNLINLICSDIEKKTKYFLDHSSEIIKLEKYQNDKQEEGKEDPIIKQIKTWFDAANDAIRIIRYFSVRTSKMKGNVANAEMEEMLSSLLNPDIADWSKWYDSIRNYLTQRPQDEVKDNMLKLNFGSSSLLGGWSDGEEKIKRATLLKNGKDVFLCIIKTTNIFDTSKDNPMYKKDGNASRLILRNLAFKTLAGKGFVSKYNQKYSDMGKEDPQKAIESLSTLISEKYIVKYPLLKNITDKKYLDKKQFDKEVNETLKECYECVFKPIDWDLVLKKEENGELFLFKIHCKDYNLKSVGKKDLQTLYWEDVLRENSMHQLCGGAEIFMRESLKTPPFVHKIGEKLINKKDTQGNSIPENIYREILLFANKKKKESELSEDAHRYLKNKLVIIKDVNHAIVKDKRFYSETKYFFHCPLKINYNSKSYKKPEYAFPEVNEAITDTLQQSQDLQFIGIDRGEKHLVYLCTIDKEGKIIKCGHYDSINGTDYVQKLDEKADERTKARKDWQTIGNIRNLKDGYISHAIHKIVDEAIKDKDGKIDPHSYIVLEDLNTEMKRGRQKIEKQVYQKLETALAKKLNFMVDKNSKISELGSVANALQLTPPIANYQDIEGKKQFGIMLYTRANYTSITDPRTGWRKTIYLKDGSEEKIKEQILDKFSDFGFDGKDYYFEYTEGNANKTWRLYSSKDGNCLPRFRNQKKKELDFDIWVPEAINVVEILKDVFKSFDHTKSFKEQIAKGIQLSKVADRNETAWQSLRYAIDLIQQIRNSGVKDSKDDNFLYSPVRDKNGNHFDSRNFSNNGDLSLIKDADANGAYNIARKGLIMDEHIKTWITNGKKTRKETKYSDLDLFVSDSEWDLWLLNRNEWRKKLPYFASRSLKESTEKKK